MFNNNQFYFNNVKIEYKFSNFYDERYQVDLG